MMQGLHHAEHLGQLPKREQQRAKQHSKHRKSYDPPANLSPEHSRSAICSPLSNE